MLDIWSHKSSLDQLISLSRELQSNDTSVSNTVAQIAGRFSLVETQAKVILKPITPWFTGLNFFIFFP